MQKLISALRDYFLQPMVFVARRQKLVLFKEFVALCTIGLWTYTNTCYPPMATKSVYFDYRNTTPPRWIALSNYAGMQQYLARHPAISFLNLLNMFFNNSSQSHPNYGQTYKMGSIYPVKQYMYDTDQRHQHIRPYLRSKIEKTVRNLTGQSTYYEVYRGLQGLTTVFILYQYLFTTLQPYAFKPDQINPKAVAENLDNGTLIQGMIEVGANPSDYDKNLKKEIDYTNEYILKNYTKEISVNMVGKKGDDTKVTTTIWTARKDTPEPKHDLVFYAKPEAIMWGPTQIEPNGKNKMDKMGSYLLYFFQNYSERLAILALILTLVTAIRMGTGLLSDALIERGYDNYFVMALVYLAKFSLYSSCMGFLLLDISSVFDYTLLFNALFHSHNYHYELDQSKLPTLVASTGFLGAHTILGWLILICGIPFLSSGGYTSVLRPILTIDLLTQPSTYMHSIAFGLGSIGGLINPYTWLHSASFGILSVLVTLIVTVLNVFIIFELTLIPGYYIHTSLKRGRTFLRTSWVSNEQSTTLTKTIEWIYNGSQLKKQYATWRLMSVLKKVKEPPKHEGLMFTYNKKDSLKKEIEQVLQKNDIKPDIEFLKQYGGLTPRGTFLFKKYTKLKLENKIRALEQVDTTIGLVEPTQATSIHTVLETSLTQKITSILLVIGLNLFEVFLKFSVCAIKFFIEIVGPLILINVLFNTGLDLVSIGEYTMVPQFNTVHKPDIGIQEGLIPIQYLNGP